MTKKYVFAIIGIIAFSGIFLLITVISKERKDAGRKQVNKTVNSQSPNELMEELDTEPYVLNETEDAEMVKMTQELIDWTMADLEQIRYEDMLRNPASFASLARKHEMIYTEAIQNFGPNDLPEMYSLLNQNKHKNEWRFIAQLIGFVSNRGNKNSIDVLLNYLQRQDVWPETKQNRIKSFDVGIGKILCLEWIGMIGGEYAEEILLKAVTPEGAEEIAKQWLHFTEVSFPGGKKDAISYIRGRAAMGLVYCQSSKGDEILERIYKEEKEKCIQNGVKFSEMFHQIVSAMAHKDFIQEHGLRKRFELYGSDEYLEVISPYIEKYWLR